MLKVPLTLLSPAGARGRLSILIFHRVLRQPDPLAPDEPDAAAFEAQMRWVRAWFNVLPLAMGIDLLYAGKLPARALSITFDDGYADNSEVAAPILEHLGLTATFFIATGYLAGGCMWNDRIIEAIRACRADQLDLTHLGLGVLSLELPADRRRAVMSLLNAVKHRTPDDRSAAVNAVVAATGADEAPPLMMTSDQVRQLGQRGMDVGAHTVSHPILATLGLATARQEILASKAHLEELLGRPLALFAYPNGVPQQDYTAEHVRMVRDCGFTAAVTTAWGAATARSDRYQLPRFTPWDRTRLRYGSRLMWNIGRKAAATV